MVWWCGFLVLYWLLHPWWSCSPHLWIRGRKCIMPTPIFQYCDGLHLTKKGGAGGEMSSPNASKGTESIQEMEFIKPLSSEVFLEDRDLISSLFNEVYRKWFALSSILFVASGDSQIKVGVFHSSCSARGRGERGQQASPMVPGASWEIEDVRILRMLIRSVADTTVGFWTGCVQMCRSHLDGVAVFPKQ